MKETKSIGRADMVLGISLDNMTTDFSNLAVMGEQAEDILKEDNKQKKLKQKQISKGNKDQEGRHPCYDPIPVSYAHLLSILVKARAIVPKHTEPVKLPYGRKHDPHSMC
ncbi:hypothetical protein KIW84_045963 [Lathyrus oleraceus]|uniref:Uncharacterized protein n=1 Tax=Pisum sativum TaxID=3888 RepID=A0A9D4XKJ4_PEA|nr:hypothetical protein KIW84_045963 [Pisum sativum]